MKYTGECTVCGDELGIFRIKKGGKITKSEWFSETPLKLYGVEYYRTRCVKCIEKELGRCPKSANVFNNDHKEILNIPEDVFKRKKNERFGFTKEKWIEKYGEKEGLKKWENYRKKQSYTNSYEYKKEKYGWSKERFNEYNKSRAVTKENMIKRHGEKEGLKKWGNYRKKQSYTNSLEYFIEKYGEKEGLKKWNKVNKQKAFTIENMIRVHGKKKGTEIWLKSIEKRNNNLYYSKVSQELFWLIWDKISDKNWKTYFKELNKEFLLQLQDSVIFLDFVVIKKSNDIKCIEFNGDFWHCNPNIYESDRSINYPGKGIISVSEIWERDRKRLELIKDKKIDIMIVWENDYYKNRKEVLDKCIKFLEI